MATFQAQVQGITGLTIDGAGTNTSTAELTQFLTDGAKDVINKILIIDPTAGVLFSTSAEITNGNGLEVDGPIVSVVRGYAGSGGSGLTYRPCDPINSDEEGNATDVNSLSYRGSYNPCYYIKNSTLFILPAPSSGDDRGKIEYVTYPTVAFGDSSIGTSYVVATGVEATLATPTIFDKTGHSFVNGDKVRLSGFTEATELNGITGIVEGVSGQYFQIDGVYVDGAAESTGGTVEKVVPGFPDQYEYLVVLYASIKCVELKLATYTIDEEDMELVQSYQTNLVALKQEYANAFSLGAGRERQPSRVNDIMSSGAQWRGRGR